METTPIWATADTRNARRDDVGGYTNHVAKLVGVFDAGSVEDGACPLGEVNVAYHHKIDSLLE